MAYEHEREYFRILYPTAARPRFLSGGLVQQVVGLSEQGLRCRVLEGEVHDAGEEVG